MKPDRLILLLVACLAAGLGGCNGDAKSEKSTATAEEELDDPGAAGDDGDDDGEDKETTDEDDEAADNDDDTRTKALIAGLTVFVLAIFIGFEVITKVPPTLHTPLMSGSNAISGITIVGAVTVAGVAFSFSSFVGMIAVALATINVVGGFLVTHRMLSMFKKR